MHVGVVDIGTNSTRLLVCEVGSAGAVTELERRSEVTRLGQGLEASGRLDDAAMARVFAVLDEFRRSLRRHRCETTVAVLTSAVREAANGDAFTQQVRERYELQARTISGDEEAELTFLGAMSEHAGGGEATAVIDIGGGSTEIIIGTQGAPDFNVSMRLGVVRMSERHIHADPPTPVQLQAVAADARSVVHEALPEAQRAAVRAAIAVAGTATAAAAIAQELDPYDASRVHGYRLALGEAELLLERMAALSEAQRREVAGLHPDRAPVIVAGLVILIELLRALELEQVEVSEHDILRGAALRAVGVA